VITSRGVRASRITTKTSAKFLNGSRPESVRDD